MSNRNADETEGLASTAPYFQAIHNGSYHEAPSHSLTEAIEADYRASQQLAHDPQSYGDGQNNVVGVAASERDASIQGDAEAQAVTNAELARLLEAVKSGTGQSDAMSVDAGDAGYHEMPFTAPAATLGKRKRNEEASELNRKRSKNDADPPADPGLPFTPLQPQYSQPTVAAARAAGVHSAVALFRSPSASSAKKYTRPPMSKLYGSLHLTPENFLHLQAAAKTYMLDPKHPDRQECVGVRGQTSVDMAKLRLFNCVKEFLEDGVGETFFPEHQSDSNRGQNNGEDRMSADAPGFGDDDSKRWVWPRDAESIISLVTPLMRRMVTNERQRMYAAESRKGGSAKKSRSTPGHGEEEESAVSMHDGAFGTEQHILDPSLQRTTSAQASPTPDTRPMSSSALAAEGVSAQEHALEAMRFRASTGPPAPPPPKLASDVIQFVFMRGRTKLLRFDWPNDGPLHVHMTFEKLVGVVNEHVNSVRVSFPEPLDTVPPTDAGLAGTIAEVAKRKARATLLAAEDGRDGFSGADTELSLQADQNAASPEDNPSELLRRELQQATEGADRSPFDNSKVAVKALTASGLINVETEVEWEEIKRQIADTVWLEGCLRIVVDVL